MSTCFRFKHCALIIALFCNKVPAADPVSYGGTRLSQFQNSLSQVFPATDKVEEFLVYPKKLGGTTFMGLIGRLLGDRPNRKYESMSAPRYIYQAFKDKKMVGIAHGATAELPSGPANIFVYYGLDRSIKNLRVDGVPESILKQLHEGNHLQSFVGYKVEDFEKQARYKGRRGRRKSYWEKGQFLVQEKGPKSRHLREYWKKIVRSVRFNAAFMDVAFFITRHPELDNHERISNIAVSGPEKEVEGTRLSTPDNHEHMVIRGSTRKTDPASSN